MKIRDGWKIKDEVSGLKVEVRAGKSLDRLRIESLDGKMNRNFWFTKDGKFDGTGTSFCSGEGEGEEKENEK